jgi:two-component system sensor histidine kinase VicK
MFSIFHLSNKDLNHINEYDSANWAAIIILPIFYIISTQLIKHFKPSVKFLKWTQLFVILFSSYLILGAMRASFFSMHNPRNTMLMYMMGVMIVAAFYTFEYYETLIITLAAGLVFSLLLPFYQHAINELVLNNLASLIILVSFYALSRYLFSYRADNFFKIKAIEEKNIEIEVASNAKNEILGVVAHDLRNPLAVIRSITMLMETDDPKADDYLENLQMIQASCDKASSIINDLLETAQNEIDNNFDFKQTELDTFLFTIIDEWRKNKKGQVNIVYNAAGAHTYAHINTEKMQRVLDNLIINAIKFSGPNGTIEIALSVFTDEVEISVKDSGIGIPEDIQPYIFDRFSKARRNGVRGEASVGLGLSIVQQIVRKHNGDITVRSNEKDGTIFTITLPRIKPDKKSLPIIESMEQATDKTVSALS